MNELRAPNLTPEDTIFLSRVPDDDDGFLARSAPQRERGWTVAMIESGARSRGRTPEGRLLAVFDVLDDLVNRADREARLFVEILAGMSGGRMLGLAGEDILTSFRALIDTLATEAELRDVHGVVMSFRILLKGSILGAVEGDLEAALRARAMAEDLVSRHRPLEPANPGVYEASASALDFEEIALYTAQLDRLEWALR